MTKTKHRTSKPRAKRRPTVAERIAKHRPALIDAGLLTLATEDEFGRWLVSQAGRLDRDFDIGL